MGLTCMHSDDGMCHHCLDNMAHSRHGGLGWWCGIVVLSLVCTGVVMCCGLCEVDGG